MSFYTHDGNKNVSEVVVENCDIAAHYEYAPFGAETIQSGYSSADNLWRFSSEYAEAETGCCYYNFREYSSFVGRWMSMALLNDSAGKNTYGYVDNSTAMYFDYLGMVNQLLNNTSIFSNLGFALSIYNS